MITEVCWLYDLMCTRNLLLGRPILSVSGGRDGGASHGLLSAVLARLLFSLAAGMSLGCRMIFWTTELFDDHGMTLERP